MPGPANRAGRRPIPTGGGGSEKLPLYLGLGAAGLAVILIGFMMSSGSGSSSASKGRSADQTLAEIIEEANKTRRAGDTAGALWMLDQAIQNPALKGSKHMSVCKAQAENFRTDIRMTREADERIKDFKNRVEASKANQTAMKKANEFWAESEDLLTRYGAYPAARELRPIRDDLRRWVATENQGDWQKDYNRTKSRIQSQHLDKGDFTRAAREWRHFMGSASRDPLLTSRVDQELRTIDQLSAEAARKLIEVAGSGDMARRRLEEEIVRFEGTEGQKVITKKLAEMK